ncbi:isocitrate lyase/PEP mutase family protein [Sphingomonas naphthae]|uniref:Isocitrate lyase/PEP mutase family protein n=1 Tax=Sphingomonas naphthae TaxID=1813468 RepID=A0ABY7TMZ1_9SPHN|nr:isocitrate lyase/PEP mutase family protein [Sphingomonas naphthae]WCT74346.1 isocitrate lyase/PEP mutase family protein [Sphingomonas naphthae]
MAAAGGHVAALRSLIAADEHGRRTLMSVPGCWDGLTALLIEQAGFPAAFLSGGALSMARLGRPDIGLTTMGEAADAVAMIRDRIAIPLIVDGDTGFGNALNMQRTVRSFERAGASAIQIEDQVFPKRCGHMAGKAVVPIAEAVGKVRAAVDARTDMLVIARTDAVGPEGIGAAMDRAEAYLEAGADLLFIEGPRDLAATQAVANRFAARVPLVHNLVEGGVSATKSGAELEAMGFAIAIHPLLLMHGLVAQAPGLLAHLAAHRSTEGLGDAIADLATMNRITGAAALLAEGDSYAG